MTHSSTDIYKIGTNQAWQDSLLIILPDIKFCIKIYKLNHVQTSF